MENKCRSLTGPELHVELSRIALFVGLLIRDIHRSQFSYSDPDGPPQYDLPPFVNNSILSVNDIHDRLLPRCITFYKLAKACWTGQADHASPVVGPSNISTTTPEVEHHAPEARNKRRKRTLNAGGVDARPAKVHRPDPPTQTESTTAISGRPQRKRHVPGRFEPGEEGIPKVGPRGRGKKVEAIVEEPEEPEELEDITRKLR